ncbi:MAG: thymidylate synthase (FAD), partial [Dehalococcoidia bacterium]
MNIIRQPKVYLLGRQNMDSDAVQRFLDDYGMTWQTDTEIGGEQLVEIGGRVCYFSFGKGRKTNSEYIGHLIGMKHGSVL